MRRLLMCWSFLGLACLDTSIPDRASMEPGTVRATVLVATPGRADLSPAEGARVRLIDSSLEAVADAEGQIVLSGIEVTSGRLLFAFDADRDGSADRSRVLSLEAIRAGRGRGDVTLGNVVLSRNSSMVGKVLLGDRSMLPVGHAGTDVVLQGLAPTTRTGDDGSFLLTGVPEGDLVMVASRMGYVSDATALMVGAAEEKRVPTLVLAVTSGSEPVGRITGLVVSSDGAPVPAVQVGLQGMAGRSTSTDPFGRYAFETVPSGTWTLRFNLSGFVSRQLSDVVVARATVDLPVVVLEREVVDAGTGGGVAGGMAGGVAGGMAGGVAGGMAGGVAGGTAGGVAGGMADVTPPVVMLSVSANTVIASGALTFTATATDSVGVARVEFYEGLSLLASATMPTRPNQYDFTRSFTSANNGSRQYVVRAFDAAGNLGTSNAVTVNVSIVAPSSPIGFGGVDGCRYIVLNDGRVLATSRGLVSGACSGQNIPSFLAVNGLSGVATASQVLSGFASLFVRTDGTLACVGTGTQCGPMTLSPPNINTMPGVSNAVSAASGPAATCVVRADTTAACWSGDYLGSSGGQTSLPRTVTWPDAGVITGATRVHSCNGFTVIQLANGQLVSFGRNDSSTPIGVGFVVFSFGSPPSSVVDTMGQPVRNVVDFACGQEHAIIASSDAGLLGFGRTNSVFGLGGNAPFGNPGLAVDSRFDSAVPAGVGLSQIVDVECGLNHTVALDRSGQVWVWGQNQSGQLGTGGTATSALPVQLAGLPPITAVAAGRESSLAIAADGRVFAWGLRSEIGIPDAGMLVLTPRTVDLP
jgi:hypothetical protein